MAAHDHAGLRLFRSSHAALVNNYLAPKISAHRNGYNCSFFPFINEADIYSKPPHQLVTDHAPAPVPSGEASAWYFFTRRRFTSDNQKRWSRTVAGTDGHWHSETGKKEVEGTVGGYLTMFSYKVKTTTAAASGSSSSYTPVRPGWVMAEYSYSIDGCFSDTVLCKVYRSPRESAGSGSGVQPSTRTRARDGDEPPPHLPPGAEDRSETLLDAARRFLMDDDYGTMNNYGEEIIDAFSNKLLQEGGGDGYEQREAAPPSADATGFADLQLQSTPLPPPCASTHGDV